MGGKACLCPNECLLPPLSFCVGDGYAHAEADESVGLHPSQKAVVLLLDVSLELSSSDGQWLEHVADANRCPDLPRGRFLVVARRARGRGGEQMSIFLKRGRTHFPPAFGEGKGTDICIKHGVTVG